MSLPIYKRYEILFLAKNRYGPHFGIKKIAKIVHCSTSIVKPWLTRWKDNKNLDNQLKEGLPWVTTEDEERLIVKATLDIEEPTSKNVQDHVQSENVYFRQRTVRRRLRDAGFRFSLPLSKPLLTLKHQEDRLRWTKLVQNINWNKVIATDETTFRLNTVRQMHWQLQGSRTIKRTVEFPIKVHVWGSMTSKGFGKIACFKHNLESHFFMYSNLSKCVASNCKKLFWA